LDCRIGPQPINYTKSVWISKDQIVDNYNAVDLSKLIGIVADDMLKGSAPYPLLSADEEAKKRGHAIRLPLGNQLFIDIDNENDWTKFQENYVMLYKYLMADKFCESIVWSYGHSPSEKPNHFHVTVTFNGLGRSLGTVERMFLQAILGSDAKREMLSYIQSQRGVEEPTVFFVKT